MQIKKNTEGDLDLRGTNITELPDGLSVGGDLDLRDTNINNYPVVYDCGTHNRAIYLDLKDKSKIRIVHKNVSTSIKKQLN